jgi:hypothetical protein
VLSGSAERKRAGRGQEEEKQLTFLQLELCAWMSLRNSDKEQKGFVCC